MYVMAMVSSTKDGKKRKGEKNPTNQNPRKESNHKLWNFPKAEKVQAGKKEGKWTEDQQRVLLQNKRRGCMRFFVTLVVGQGGLAAWEMLAEIGLLQIQTGV